jgi:hypothetical protein
VEVKALCFKIVKESCYLEDTLRSLARYSNHLRKKLVGYMMQCFNPCEGQWVEYEIGVVY